MSLKLGLGGKTEGAYVLKVLSNTPAFKANILPHDVIVEYQGKPVKNIDDFRNRVMATDVGTKVALKIIRDGKPIELSLLIAEQPEEEKLAAAESEEEQPEKVAPSFGIIPQKLTPSLAKKYGYEEDEGVLVGSVEDGSPAELRGLKEGDLIRKVDGKPVKTIKEFNDAMEAAKQKKSVSLLVHDKEGLFIVPLRIGETEQE
jgi:serine protease Do